MALFQPLLLAVDDLAQKLGLNLSISAQSGTIPHDGNTWSLTSLGVPAVIAGLLYWYLKPSHPSKQRDATGTNTTATKDSSSTKKMAPRPADGQIKVVDILIHPLKSCRGVSLKECNFTPDGLENDRRYCIIDATNHSLMTAREVAKMVLITPRIEGDKLIATFPGGSGVKPFTVPLSPTPEQMATWEVIRDIKFFSEKLDGHIVTPLDDASGSPTESLSAYFGKPCVLVYKGVEDRYADPTVEFPELKATVKYQDAYPVLVLSEESMEVVEKEIRGRVGTQGIEENWREDKIHYRRFRPNIVLSGGGPFAEDDWEEISVGDPFAPKFQIVNKAARCLLPNVSPETGERDKAVPYKVIMKFRMGLDPKHKMKPCIGSNSVPQGNGTIRVGETVYIKKMIGEEPIPVAPPAEESEVPPPLEQL